MKQEYIHKVYSLSYEAWSMRRIMENLVEIGIRKSNEK